jgi:hypothetical protein
MPKKSRKSVKDKPIAVKEDKPVAKKGGAKLSIYCGSKPKIPQGKIRGKPNTCYKIGLKSGFRAGVDKGKNLSKRTVVAERAAERASTIRGLENRMYLTKAWFRDNSNTLNIGVLRKLNRILGGAGDNESVRKPNIIQFVNNADWNRIRLTELL